MKESKWRFEQKDLWEKIGNACFFIGLYIELMVLILDKCAWINPYESLMFRVGFCFFALKVFLTKYSMKEWFAIGCAGILAVICYLCSTKDEAVRIVVFVVSMKGINGKYALKTVFWTTVAGVVLLAVLAIGGVLGTVYELDKGYGFKEGMTRICLGMGSSNTFSIMVWALMTLGIYLYHDKMKWLHYGFLLLLSGVVYVATVTRTSLLMMLFTILLAMVLQYYKKIRQCAILYVGGIVSVLLCLAFSVYAAYVSDEYALMPNWVVKIDRLITGRIFSIQTYGEGSAALEKWKLFSAPEYEQYFDMGYVRLFYWYGIVPGICVMAVLCLLLWNFRKNGDYMGFVMTLALSLFTVIEAHTVSVYIARNYVLFLLGMYWPQLLGKQAEEANWWRIHTLIKRR